MRPTMQHQHHNLWKHCNLHSQRREDLYTVTYTLGAAAQPYRQSGQAIVVRVRCRRKGSSRSLSC